MLRCCFFLFILGLFCSCTHLRSLSTTGVPKDRSKTVEAISERTIFLGFNFDNDYVDSISAKLARECPNGKVQGLLTKHETINYFLFIVWKSRVTSKGYCVGNTVSLNRKKRKMSSETDEIKEEI